jgi:hypothetical protein
MLPRARRLVALASHIVPQAAASDSSGAGQQTQTAVADDGVPPQQLHLGADGMAELDPNLSIHAGHGPDALLQVRKTPSWPRSWANFSPLSLYPRRNARANLHILGQPNSLLARSSGCAAWKSTASSSSTTSRRTRCCRASKPPAAASPPSPTPRSRSLWTPPGATSTAPRRSAASLGINSIVTLKNS